MLVAPRGTGRVIRDELTFEDIWSLFVINSYTLDLVDQGSEILTNNHKTRLISIESQPKKIVVVVVVVIGVVVVVVHVVVVVIPVVDPTNL